MIRWIVCFAILLLNACTADTTSPKHLFILSGQSNMTGGVKKGFQQTVEQEFGKENVIIAMSMKSGRGIRFWVKDYQAPVGSILDGKKMADNGSEYPPLVKAAKKAMNGHQLETVNFIWMQGESDASRSLADSYEESFLKLISHLKSDLNVAHMNFVIGRISKWGLSTDKADGWIAMRDVQVKIADSHDEGAWVDTDDLEGDLHYTKEASEQLGVRLAKKSIELIRK